MDAFADAIWRLYESIGGVLSSPLGRWLAPPFAALVAAAVLVALPLVFTRRLAYAVRSTPFFAVRAAKVAVARGRKRLHRGRLRGALRDLDFVVRALAEVHTHSATNRALYVEALDLRALAYERLNRWAEAGEDLSQLSQQASTQTHPSRASWLRRLAAAKRQLGMHAEAAKLDQDSDLLDRITRVPATASPILRLWPKVETLFLSPAVDSAELRAALADVTALARRDPTNGNAAYAKALLELKAGEATAVASLSTAATLLPGDFADVYYWRALARAWSRDWDGCLQDSRRAATAVSLGSSVPYLEGYARFNLGRFVEALESFARALEVEPSHIEAHRGRVVALTRLQRWEQAIAEADRALERGVIDSAISTARGEAALHLRRFDEAIAHSTEALALAQAPAAYAHRVRGVAHVQKQQWAEAIADLTAALQSDQTDGVSYAYRAEAYRMHGELSKAVKDADLAVSCAADLPLGHLERALATLARWGKEKNAELLTSVEADCAWIVAREPANASAYWVQALVKHARGEQDEALRTVNHALSLDSTLGGAYQTRGWLHLSKADWSAAADDFRKALEYVGPADVAQSYLGLAECERLCGKVAASIEFYDTAIRRAPAYAEAHYGRGLACAASRKWRDAIDSYSAALRNGLELQDLRRSRAMAYFESRLDAEALKDLAGAAAPDARSLDLLLQWGFILVGIGRPREAIQVLTEAVEREPRSGEAYSTLGWARAVAGDLDGALHDCSRGVELAPTAAHVNNRAWVLGKLGQWIAASDDCDRAIRLDGSFDYAFKNRSLARWSLGKTRSALADLSQVVRLRQASGAAPAKDRVDVLNWEDQARDWAGALERRGVDAPGLVGYAIALWMSGQHRAATDAVQHALRIDPRLQLAVSVLSMVNRAGFTFQAPTKLRK